VVKAQDQRRAAVIETLLCQEAVDLPADLLDEARDGLAPFLARGLARIEGQRLVLAPHSALSSLHRRAVRCLSRRWASVQFGGVPAGVGRALLPHFEEIAMRRGC
jgi:hypothetical protein